MDFSKARENKENLIPNQDLFVVMMRRVWLDNALNLACQEVCQLLTEITSDVETNQENLKTLCKEARYGQTLRQEWENKELALGRLADLLESARRQIRSESLILSEEDPSATKEE